MQMVCPECNRVESFDKLPMRSQKCAHCGLYLSVPPLEPNRPEPSTKTASRVIILERQRLSDLYARLESY